MVARKKTKWSRIRCHPIWSISSTVKDICLFKVCWEKERKTNISPFSAYTYTHKLTFKKKITLPWIICITFFQDKSSAVYPSQYEKLRLLAKFLTCGVALITFYKTAPTMLKRKEHTPSKGKVTSRRKLPKSCKNHIL